jgi:hypothetical protein
MSKANPIRINVNDGLNRFIERQWVQAHRLCFWHVVLRNGKRNRFGSPMTGTRPSLLCGIIWVLRGSTVANASLQIEGEWPVLFRGKSNLPLLTGLTLGGKRNYGFGRVRCAPISETLAKQLEALWPAEFSRFSLKGALLGHSPFAPNMPFKGAVEIVASREYPRHGRKSYELSGLSVSSSGYFFTPGTVIATNVEASLDPLGRILLDGAAILHKRSSK